MSLVTEVRCTAPHPKVRGWQCRAKLADVIAGTVVIAPGLEVQPGSSRVRCDKCGTEYVLTPTVAA